MNISYSALVLDEPSRTSLIGMLGDAIPGNWEVVAHHMTITMGPLLHPKGKHDFSQTYVSGETFDLPVTSVGMDGRAMAVQVMAPFPINRKTKFPHVTVAVNREEGGKPFHSNKIPIESFKDISHWGLVLRGQVMEIPQ